MKLIVGLGNPGKDYEKTRHNVGFMCLDNLKEKYNLDFRLKKEFKSEIATQTINGEKCVFIKPQTFMNLSGEALILVANFYKINNKDIYVIHDDMDLPLGSIRLREKGSAGGHNGIKNIILHLGTEDFNRIRVGISGHLDIDAKDYVLGRFSKEENETLIPTIEKISEAIEDIISGIDFQKVMQKYNGKSSK